MAKLLQARFDDVTAMMEAVEATATQQTGGIYVDAGLLKTWLVRTEALIADACGEHSKHLAHFVEAPKKSFHTTNRSLLHSYKNVFLAAKLDFEAGYLTPISTLVQADLFSSELEQAQELLEKGYKTAGAVIAGVVLETALRKMCDEAGIPQNKLDRMNSDLAKAEAYNVLQQKRITMLAQIRNDAAHGKPNNFTDADVHSMIAEVGSFLAQHFN